jgi:hypothetical protein
VEDVSPRRSAAGAAEGSASAPAEPDRGTAIASAQRPLGERREPAPDAAEEVAAFSWWHPAAASRPRANHGSGTDEPEQLEEPSFEPLAGAPAGTPQRRRPEASKPIPSALSTVRPDETPHPALRHSSSWPETQSQPRRAVAGSVPPRPALDPAADVLLLDTPAPERSPEPPFLTLRAGVIPAPTRPARAFRSRTVCAVLVAIVVCGAGAIYAGGYLDLGAELTTALARHAVSPSAATADASSRSASGGAAAHATASVILTIPPPMAAPDAAAIVGSSTSTGSKTPDPPPLPGTFAPPRARAELPLLAPTVGPSTVTPAHPLHSSRSPRPDNHPPAASLEPASTPPQPEDPADSAGRSALPESTTSAVATARSPAVPPVFEIAPVRLARGGDVSVVAASPPRPSANETALPPAPRPHAALVPAAPLAPEPPTSPVEALAPPAAASVVDRLPPPAARDPRPEFAPALPSATAPAPPAAQPAIADRAAVVEAPAAQIDPAVLVRRGRELLAAGDIASARRFFERAAEAGNAPAATGVGRTYDPLYLRQAARGLRGDPETAANWYRRAIALGDTEAGVLLMRLLEQNDQLVDQFRRWQNAQAR